jgi:hypothetical protein
MGAKHVSAEEAEFIAEAYRSMTLPQVVEAVNERFGLNRTVNGMKQYVFHAGIRSGRTGQIAPGAPAWNKGKKGVNGKSNTTFKKGNRPPLTRPLFFERVGKDGEIQIKVGERGRAFISKARYLWEQKHGPLPKGQIVRFLDGDNRNFADDNLVAVTRRLHAALNKGDIGRLPRELKRPRFLATKLEVMAKVAAEA